jgi:hypothetical protein
MGRATALCELAALADDAITPSAVPDPITTASVPMARRGSVLPDRASDRLVRDGVRNGMR